MDLSGPSPANAAERFGVAAR